MLVSRRRIVAICLLSLAMVVFSEVRCSLTRLYISLAIVDSTFCFSAVATSNSSRRFVSLRTLRIAPHLRASSADVNAMNRFKLFSTLKAVASLHAISSSKVLSTPACESVARDLIPIRKSCSHCFISRMSTRKFCVNSANFFVRSCRLQRTRTSPRERMTETHAERVSASTSALRS